MAASHPGRIEEIVVKSRKEVEDGMVQAAEEILYELGVHGVHPEIMKTLGRLKFRTSYGQNQLLHAQRSRAWWPATWPPRWGSMSTMTKRWRLLHDVGKGSDARAGRHARRAGLEPVQEVQRAGPGAERDQGASRRGAASLRRDLPGHCRRRDQRARPGARREMFETYVKRLEKLEEIATRVPRRRALLRDPGRPRDPRDGRSGERERYRHDGAERADRTAARGRAAVSRADQGRGNPRDPRGGLSHADGKDTSPKDDAENN